MKSLKRTAWAPFVFAGVVLLGALISVLPAQERDDRKDQDEENESRVRRGFEIAPVQLNLEDKNHALVGLGSYLVNAPGSCNSCHTCPSYKPGHNPFNGEGEQINAPSYLAGGVPFGPGGLFTARNITPDDSGKPAGFTFEQFRQVMRTGIDLEGKHPGIPLLQVMPWPNHAKMTDRDLRAIYEYLSAIPHLDDSARGTCLRPDQ
jgi:hypothetical protein